jgi:hypothetical protein
VQPNSIGSGVAYGDSDFVFTISGGDESSLGIYAASLCHIYATMCGNWRVKHALLFENRTFRFVRGHSVPREMSAIDLVPFELNLSPLHSDNCINTVVTLTEGVGKGEFRAEKK